MRRFALIAAMLSAMSASSASAELSALKMEDPRPFGYFTGDVIVRRAVIDLDDGSALVRASLPRPGPVTYWLDLKDVDIEENGRGGGKRYAVTLTYQTFYVPYDARKLTIPAWTLMLAGGSGPHQAVIPAFTYTSSPLREIFPEKSGETVETFLRADAKPRSIDVQPLKVSLIACLVAAALAILLLARQLALWPFRRRPDRPFTRAARFLASAPAASHNLEDYRKALLVLHRAFDEASGHRILASDLNRFFSEYPEYSGRRREIADFFESSRRAFFGDDIAGASERFPIGALRKLSRELSVQERSRP